MPSKHTQNEYEPAFLLLTYELFEETLEITTRDMKMSRYTDTTCMHKMVVHHCDLDWPKCDYLGYGCYLVAAQ